MQSLFRIVTRTLGRLAPPTLLCLASASCTAATYELGPNCKERTGGWGRNFGPCDSEGRLHGRGMASQGNLLIFGDFVAGIPNGPQYIFISNRPEVDFGTQGGINSVIARLQKDVSLLDAKEHQKPRMLCRINFTDGKPADNLMNCSGLEMRSHSGPVQMKMDNGQVSFTMLDVEVSGRHPNGRSPLLGLSPYNHVPHVLTGRAAAAKLSYHKQGFTGEAQLMIEKLSGSYTGTVMDAWSRPKAERWMKGNFNYRLTARGGHALLNTVPLDGKPTQPLGAEHLYEFSAFGKVFTAAVYKADLGSADVHYLKTDDGVEFDASGFELCLRKTFLGGPPGPWGYAQVEQFNGANGYEFRFVPRCGKVTDKSGRSYAGLFDSNGRPASN